MMSGMNAADVIVHRNGYVFSKSVRKGVEAHFLTCSISLLIVRILEHELEHKYSSEQILTSIRKANVAQVDGSSYLNL